jgi:5'-3' exonuclease
MANPMQIHLLDGTYELFRAYFGAPTSLDRGGREVGASRALMRSLVAWLASDRVDRRGPGPTGAVTHLAVAFDTVIESFRNRLFAGYKTGEGIDPALFSQFPLAERVTRALGIVTWSMVEFEADDALATFAMRAAESAGVSRVLICTPDKDLAQCVVGERVVCYDRHRDRILDAAGVHAKFGVTPRSIPDYLALVGDSADGIPGVPRWGAKSASVLLDRFVTLEAIPRDPAAWNVRVRGAAALAESLAEHAAAAELYKQLATLRSDVPLAEEVDDLRYRGPDWPALEALCVELGEERALARLEHFRGTARS